MKKKKEGLLWEQWRQREFKVGGDESREPTVRLPD